MNRTGWQYGSQQMINLPTIKVVVDGVWKRIDRCSKDELAELGYYPFRRQTAPSGYRVLTWKAGVLIAGIYYYEIDTMEMLPVPEPEPDVPIGEVDKIIAEYPTLGWDILKLRGIE